MCLSRRGMLERELVSSNEGLLAVGMGLEDL